MPSSLPVLAALDRAKHRGDLLLCPEHVRRGAAHVDAAGPTDHRDVHQRHPRGGPLGPGGRARSASFAATVANSAGVISHTSRVGPGIGTEPPRLRLMITACRSVM